MGCQLCRYILRYMSVGCILVTEERPRDAPGTYRWSSPANTTTFKSININTRRHIMDRWRTLTPSARLCGGKRDKRKKCGERSSRIHPRSGNQVWGDCENNILLKTPCFIPRELIILGKIVHMRVQGTIYVYLRCGQFIMFIECHVAAKRDVHSRPIFGSDSNMIELKDGT